MSSQTQTPPATNATSAPESKAQSQPAGSTTTSDPALDSSDPTTSHSQKPLLALPEAGSAPNYTLDMSSGQDSVKLDHLGPMVVGKDGTLARVANWESMTEGEKKLTLRMLGKRNKERLEVLRGQNKEESGK